MRTPPDKLRTLLSQGRILTVPACFDAYSAHLAERAGFPATFMSGFSVAATRLALPDTGLISYGEMVDQGRRICEAVSIPVLGDGDTGYGNAMNIRRTVEGYARAGFAAVMIEDQVAPKRCGHTRGKAVVGRDEALDRIKAAVDARNEGSDILLVARTDARHEHGLGEAIARAQAFAELGAEILFVEAPKSEEELAVVGREVPGWKFANLVEGGETPVLPHARLEELGFSMAVYAVTLLSAATRAMTEVLEALANDADRGPLLTDFETLKDRVGFNDYYALEERYAAERD